MRIVRKPVAIVGPILGLLFMAGTASATDISGTISSTVTIFEDSQLVGDVTCTVVDAPCIQFGASDIELELNGFTMTGTADPNVGCSGAPFPPFPTPGTAVEDGIFTNGMSDLRIKGPGLVQRFRKNGIRVSAPSTRVKVRRVTASTNCLTGILLLGTPDNPASDNDVEDSVAVRNGNIRCFCGGIEIFFGHNNRIRRNVTSGNGYVDLPPELPGPRDFGIGVLGNDNVIEKNSAVGNTNGIVISSNATNNTVVRRNIVTGNPSIQVSNSFPTFVGADIFNFSATTVFKENLCVTSLGTFPAFCPNTPKVRGHEDEKPKED